MLYYFTPRSQRPMLGKVLAGLFLMRVLGMV